MTLLSVNINKVATLRNARGGNVPDVIKTALDCESFGAQGITVHPRPDGRHITYKDVRELNKVLNYEFNIEGYPSEEFIELVLEVVPDQVTLVPDPPDAITSNAGWNVKDNFDFIAKCVKVFQAEGIRVSIFMENELDQIEWASKTGTNRIELYTEAYAVNYDEDREKAVEPYIRAAEYAKQLGLEINAGHDLNLSNLRFFAENIPWLKEVSIGHALICDALYFGLENTIQSYKRELSF